MRPSDAVLALADQLQQRGVTGLIGKYDHRVGVLSVAYGLTVWTDGTTLCWRTGGTPTKLPATDPLNAARALTKLAREALPADAE